MSDERLRVLERASAGGDMDAWRLLPEERARAGLPRFLRRTRWRREYRPDGSDLPTAEAFVDGWTGAPVGGTAYVALTHPDRMSGLVLELWLQSAPDAVDARFRPARAPHMVRPACLAYHSAFPRELKSLLGPGPREGCMFLVGPCYQDDGSGLLADELVVRAGHFGWDEQPETLWVELERLLMEAYDPDERAKWAEVRQHARCAHCDGKGIVRL